MRAGLFPGQGIHPKLVAAGLAGSHPRLEEANDILGFDLRAKAARPLRNVLPTRVAQPAILVAGMIAFETEAARGTTFDVLLGHSLGEYTALVAAGSIPFADGVRLVAARAEAMSYAGGAERGGMAAILGLDTRTMRAIAKHAEAVVANDNSPSEMVLAGTDASLSQAAALTKKEGGRCVRLRVEAAFHTDAMEDARAPLAEALAKTTVRLGSIPVVSNVSTRRFRSPGETRRLLLEQLTGTVRFRRCIERLAAAGVTDVVDLGPGNVVGKLARATLENLRVPAHA